MAISEKALRQGLSSLDEDKSSEINSSEITVFPAPVKYPKKPTIEYIIRPISPLFEPDDPGIEPAYGSVTPKQWEIWVAQKEAKSEYLVKKNNAENFAAENDLRGTF